MVKIATAEMMPELKKLWHLGFGDDMMYINFVFDNLIDEQKILAYIDKETGKPQAMLCMEPMVLRTPDGYQQEAVYMYAFTTHPEFRAQGVGTKLLQGMHKYLKAKGYAASILKPADDYLFGYYGAREYLPIFSVKEATILSKDIKKAKRNCVLVPRSLDNLYNFRNSFFEETALYVNWTPAYLNFVSHEVELRNGGVVLSSCENEEGFLVYREDKKGEVYITEFAVPEHCAEDVLYTLHQRLNADKYTLRLKADYKTEIPHKVLPFAMIKWYDTRGANLNFENQPYITYVMD